MTNISHIIYLIWPAMSVQCCVVYTSLEGAAGSVSPSPRMWLIALAAPKIAY